jgi:hypothetical protein
VTNPTGPYGDQSPQNPYGAPQQPQNPYGQPPQGGVQDALPPNPYAGVGAPQNPYGQPQQGAPAGYPPPQNPYGAPQGAPQQAPPNPYAGAGQPQNPYGQPQAPNNPYGQQPQNPYGAPQGGQVPPNPYGVSAPASGGFLKKGGGFGKIRVIVAVVVLAAAGIFWLVNHGKDPGTANAGDCVHIDGQDANSAKKVACTDASANYTVIQKFSGTSDTNKCQPYADTHPSEVALYQTGKTEYVLCLDPK